MASDGGRPLEVNANHKKQRVATWTLLRKKETDKTAWSYEGRGTTGHFRLISISELLDCDKPQLVLTEWSNLDFQCDGLDDFHPAEPPPGMPRYCPISHVWQPSEGAAKRSKDANRPLLVELRNGASHTISWLGLVQAATAAKSRLCDYLWLDLLCIDQTNPDDKILQIKNMARIFSNALATLIMVGGVHAAQSLVDSSTYMQRSWTFQEAILGPDAQLLLQWDHPDSWSAHGANVGFDKLEGGLALVPLDQLVGSGPRAGGKFGGGELVAEDTGFSYREYRLDLPFNCLGLDQTALDALAASLRPSLHGGLGCRPESAVDAEVESDSDVNHGSSSRPIVRMRSLPPYRFMEVADDQSEGVLESDSDSEFDLNFNPQSRTHHAFSNRPDTGNEPGSECDSDSESGSVNMENAFRDATSSTHENYLPAGHDVAEYFLERWNSSGPSSESLRDNPNNKSILDRLPSGVRNLSLGNMLSWETDSEFSSINDMEGCQRTSIIPFKELPESEETNAYFDITYKSNSSAMLTAQAAWRNVWLRTSTEPQDLIFSIMHILGATIDVDYKRTAKDLLFELVEKSPYPGWLTVSYNIPVYPESGLVPTLPSFAAHSMPQYEVNGSFKPASELVCSEFCCKRFDVDIKPTSNVTSNGHLVCGRFFEVQASNPQVDEKDPAFFNVELHLSSPRYQFSATCKYRGSVGPVLMVVGPAQDLHRDPTHGDGTWIATPVILFLDRSDQGVWHKTGTGLLDEPVFRNKYFLVDAVKRHLRVGGAPGAMITECDCPLTRREKYMLHQLKGHHVNTVLGEHSVDKDRPSLFLAVFHSDKQRINKCLEQGADINAVDENMRGICRGTALQWAASSPKPQKEFLQFLLFEAGADINASGGYFGTALQAAAASQVDTTEIVEFLVEHGADVNITGGRYGCPLQAALFFGNDKIAMYLIVQGADMAVEEKYQKRLDDVLNGVVTDEEDRTLNFHRGDDSDR